MRKNRPVRSRFSLLVLFSGLATIVSLDQEAFGYPSFIGYGYQSCLTCHYNPQGNGPLSDYGRAVSASAISGKLFINSLDDDKLAERSSFLFGVNTGSWFRPNVDFRAIHVMSNLGEDTQDSRVIPMQADASVTLKFGKKDWFQITGAVGLYPERTVVNNETQYRMTGISREHYIGVRPIKYLGFYLGKLDKVFGIRVPDHTAYARTLNGVAQNDQTYGLVAHYAHPNVEVAAHGFVGDFLQTSDVRQKGFSAQVEAGWTKTVMLGSSFLFSRNFYVERLQTAAHARVGLFYGSSMMLEMGLAKKNSLTLTEPSLLQPYTFLQNLFRVYRGIHILTTLEYAQFATTSSEPKRVRWGGGIQYFPIQRLELRIEFNNERLIADTSSSTWALWSQIHISL